MILSPCREAHSCSSAHVLSILEIMVHAQTEIIANILGRKK